MARTSRRRYRSSEWRILVALSNSGIRIDQLAEFFNVLEDVGYAGAMSVEQEDPLYGADNNPGPDFSEEFKMGFIMAKRYLNQYVPSARGAFARFARVLERKGADARRWPETASSQLRGDKTVQEMAQVQATPKTYDVVIVGSGAGGGVAAQVLAEAGANICMLEAGDWFDCTKDSKMFGWPYDAPHRAAGTKAKPFGYFDATTFRGLGISRVSLTSMHQAPPGAGGVRDARRPHESLWPDFASHGPV